VLLQPRAEHVAIGRLGLDAYDDEVGRLLPGERDPLFTVGGDERRMAARRRGLRQALDERLVGVDEEDLLGHVRSEAYGRVSSSVNERAGRIPPCAFSGLAP